MNCGLFATPVIGEKQITFFASDMAIETQQINEHHKANTIIYWYRYIRKRADKKLKFSLEFSQLAIEVQADQDEVLDEDDPDQDVQNLWSHRATP
jgi:hypothetical protein